MNRNYSLFYLWCSRPARCLSARFTSIGLSRICSNTNCQSLKEQKSCFGSCNANFGTDFHLIRGLRQPHGKVATPEPETRVRERPNPKPSFGNSRPGLEGLVCTEVDRKTVSGSGRPNFDALASLDAKN